jgi:hypothetical protein
MITGFPYEFGCYTLQDFEWSPSDPILAAYTTEQNQLPARIVLVKLPERTEIRQKNLFSVSDIRISWHPQGDYLAVKVDRFTKTKKSTYTVSSSESRQGCCWVCQLPAQWVAVKVSATEHYYSCILAYSFRMHSIHTATV